MGDAKTTDPKPAGPASSLADALGHWRAGRQADAERLLRALVAAAPGEPDSWRALAELLAATGRAPEALGAWRALAALLPDDPTVQRQLGQALLATGDSRGAIAALGRALALDPANLRAYNNLGIAQLGAGDARGAIATLQTALARDPGYALAHANLGLALEAAGDPDGARASLTRALELDAHLSSARLALSRLLAAVDPQRARLEHERGLESQAINLMTIQRHDAARPILARLIESGSTLPFLAGLAFHCALQCCDWTDYEKTAATIDARVAEGQPVIQPFSLFVHSASAPLQRRCSEIYTARRFPATGEAAADGVGRFDADGRIRVAYLSHDFHEHATAYLVAALLELHDRSRFEVLALSYGPDDGSPMRLRLTAGVDEFVDVSRWTDAEVVAWMRARGVMIAIDLKGHTGGARTGIFARRAAPLQIQYLGYPGTMGADYIDYLVADERVIPPGAEDGYTERLLYLPASYQPNDPRRPRPDSARPREEYGLPAQGFVFGCFNNLYKITPAVFATWMDLLGEVEGAVLWLLGGNDVAMTNLRRAAVARGVDGARLVFARHAPLAEHLARYHHVDLFLDTLPCNAHTTASDALWMGVPLVTVTGSSFAGRVATSLVHAVGLPELARPTLSDYASCALDLARDRARLLALKTHLERVRTTCALFDAASYCRSLEAGLVEAWALHQRGEAPRHLHVARAAPAAVGPDVPGASS